MEFQTKTFRRLGFIYAVLCFIGSSFGVVIFFKQLVEYESFCAKVFCGGNEFMIVTTIKMLVFVLSATVSVFLKLAIDETELTYIYIFKAFMITRNLVLLVRWSVESASLKIAQIRETDTPMVLLEEELSKVTLLLLSISVVFGVEMWITNGIQRYVERASRDEESHDII
ncbi:uncharacterized protein LOC129726172 [Wyeomyia smithii]|uniref:uncharacterized protein LOC129726172 n=1 Tax=Wyeomyia smithii TaxID=174621 RepID=UPI002467CA91|nr:uncharacterized protein LOC129726172 [Wyeomyia smithii]